MKLHTTHPDDECITERVFDTETGIVYDYKDNEELILLSIHSVHTPPKFIWYSGDEAKHMFDVIRRDAYHV